MAVTIPSTEDFMRKRLFRAALLCGAIQWLAACAANPADQARQLQADPRCCTALPALAAERVLGPTQQKGALSSSSAVVALPAGRSAAEAYQLPAEAPGRVLELTALIGPGLLGDADTAAVAPLAATFLDRNGQPVAAAGDTGYMAANGGLDDAFLVSRQYRVPVGASRVVVHADPAKFGTRQPLDLGATSLMRPASGVYVAFKGRESIKAQWVVFGPYAVALREPRVGR